MLYTNCPYCLIKGLSWLHITLAIENQTKRFFFVIHHLLFLICTFTTKPSLSDVLNKSNGNIRNIWGINLKLSITIGTPIVILLICLISYFIPDIVMGATTGESFKYSEITSTENKDYSCRLSVQEVKEATGLYSKGIILMKLGLYPKAIEVFDRVIVDPEYYCSAGVSALEGKGLALYELNRYQEAIEQYDKVLAERKGGFFPHTFNNKGLALYELKRYNEAIEQYDKAIEKVEKRVDRKVDEKLFDKPFGKRIAFDIGWIKQPLNNKGVALSAMGKYKEAIEQYDLILSIFPSDINALNNKGNALSALGKYKEAMEQYDKILEIGSNLASNNMSYKPIKNMHYYVTDWKKNDIVSIFKLRPIIYMEREDWSSQLQKVVLSKEQESVLVIVRVNVGIDAYKEKNWEDAYAIFDEVLKKDSSFAPALFYKGLCLEKLGQLEEAVVYKNSSYQIDPTYKGCKLEITSSQIPKLPIENLWPVESIQRSSCL